MAQNGLMISLDLLQFSFVVDHTETIQPLAHLLLLGLALLLLIVFGLQRVLLVLGESGQVLALDQS